MGWRAHGVGIGRGQVAGVRRGYPSARLGKVGCQAELAGLASGPRRKKVGLGKLGP
jgi:hypothetical protein